MIRIQALHHPAQQLSDAEQRTLTDEILALNLTLSDSPVFEANWRSRIRSFLSDMDRFWVARDDSGALVAHIGMRILDGVDDVNGLVVYCDNYTIAPQLQNQRIGSALSVRASSRLMLEGRGRSVFLVSRTANPILMGATWSFMPRADLFFPSVDPAQPQDPELRTVALRCVERLWPDRVFDADTGVLTAAYGGSFLPTRPSHHPLVQAHFDQHVDIDRGDAVVQVMRYAPRAIPHIVRYFTRGFYRKWRRRRTGASKEARIDLLTAPRDP